METLNALWAKGKEVLVKGKEVVERAVVAVFAVGVAVFSAAPARAAGEYFTLPAADITQITSDFKTAGLIIIGIAVAVMGYRLVRKLLGK